MLSIAPCGQRATEPAGPPDGNGGTNVSGRLSCSGRRLRQGASSWRAVPAILVLAVGLVGLPSSHALAVSNPRTATSHAGARNALLSRIYNVPQDALYGLKDSTGSSMDTVKVIQRRPRDYLAVYHSYLGGVFYVRLARSADLRNFTYQATLDSSSAQPYLAVLPDRSFVLAEEKQEGGPANYVHIRFRHYANEKALLAGVPDKTFDTSRSLSQCFEGTPDIESAGVKSLTVGFHYARDCQAVPVDRQAQGILTNFSSWTTSPQLKEDQVISDAGFPGKHGDRDLITWRGRKFRLLEAQNDTDYNSFSNWRLALYDLGNGRAYPAPVKTAGGSTSMGNPSLTLLTGPSGNKLLLITVYIFGEGAAPGEAAELLYTVPADS